MAQLRTHKSIEEKIDVAAIAGEVFKAHYPDLLHRNILISIMNAQSTVGDVELLDRAGYEPRYHIQCGIDIESVTAAQAEQFFKAILGHELAHLVNGELRGWQRRFLSCCGRVPGVSHAAERYVERRADKCAISRGLGECLLSYAEYAEAIQPSRSGLYLPSSEIRGLLREQQGQGLGSENTSAWNL